MAGCEIQDAFGMARVDRRRDASITEIGSRGSCSVRLFRFDRGFRWCDHPVSTVSHGRWVRFESTLWLESRRAGLQRDIRPVRFRVRYWRPGVGDCAVAPQSPTELTA